MAFFSVVAYGSTYMAPGILGVVLASTTTAVVFPASAFGQGANATLGMAAGLYSCFVSRYGGPPGSGGPCVACVLS